MKNSLSNATKQSIQATLAGTSNLLRKKRTLWLAGMLTFFIPSVAAGAWYAGTATGQLGQLSTEINGSSNAETSQTQTQDANPNLSDQSTSASVNLNSANPGGNDSTHSPNAQVTINGQPVKIPASGNVSQTTVNNDGSTSHVNVQVNTQQNNSANSSSANGHGFTSTHVNMNSSSSSEDNDVHSSSSRSMP